MKTETRETLLSMKNSVYGKAIKEFLEENLEKIGDINSCESWEETLGRKYSLRLLKDLFAFLEDKPEKQSKANPYI